VNRRGFLKSLSALAAAAAVPASVIPEWINAKEIIGETFYLDGPMRLSGLHGFLIRNCSFIANPGFVGDWMLELYDCTGGFMTDCYFAAKEMPEGSYCIMSTPAILRTSVAKLRSSHRVGPIHLNLL